MIKQIREIYFLLDKKNKFFLYLVIFLGFFSSIFDLIGVVSILPFLSLLVNPDLINDNFFLVKINKILNFDNDEFLIFLGVVSFFLLLINQLFRFFSKMVSIYFSRKLIYEMTGNLFDYYLKQPYSFFLNKNKSLLIQKCTNYVESLVAGTYAPFILIFGQILTLSMLLSFLIFYETVSIILLTVVLSIYYFAIFKKINKKYNQLSKNYSKYFENFSKSLGDAFGVIQQLKLTKNNYFMNSFKEAANIYRKANISQNFYGFLPSHFVEVVAFSSILIISLILYFQSEELRNIIPILGVIALSMRRIIPGLQDIYLQILQVRFHSEIYKKIYPDLKNIKTYTDSQKKNLSQKIHFEKKIEFKNLNYQYEKSKNKINISLEIKKGEFLGVCGNTGVGKSTFINILSGLIKHKSGKILIDDKLVNIFDNDDWKHKIGYATQDRYILNDTIINNISLGENKRKNIKFIKKICKIVDLEKTIKKLKKKYNTKLGDSGIRFSGGQEQKIIIARSLYNNPSIIIFDEATNALDSISEKKLLKNIKKYFSNLTLIFVTHRLNSLKKCDKIVFLENTKVKAVGSFKNLLKNNSSFNNLIKANN